MKDKIRFIVPVHNFKRDLEMKRLSLTVANEDLKDIEKELELYTQQIQYLESLERTILTAVSKTINLFADRMHYQSAKNIIKFQLKYLNDEHKQKRSVCETLLSLYTNEEKYLFNEYQLSVDDYVGAEANE